MSLSKMFYTLPQYDSMGVGYFVLKESDQLIHKLIGQINMPAVAKIS